MWFAIKNIWIILGGVTYLIFGRCALVSLVAPLWSLLFGRFAERCAFLSLWSRQVAYTYIANIL